MKSGGLEAAERSIFPTRRPVPSHRPVGRLALAGVRECASGEPEKRKVPLRPAPSACLCFDDILSPDVVQGDW